MWCDFSGGALSLAQLLVDGERLGWSGILGSPVKLGLSFITIGFDVVFVLQHYVWYSREGARRAEVQDPASRNLLGGAATAEDGGRTRRSSK